MNAVWYRARAELRKSWRAWVGLGLLAGAFFGATTFAAAAARRTDTVVARALPKELPPDIYLVPIFSENGDLLKFDEIKKFPEVVESLRAILFGSDGDVIGTKDVGFIGRTQKIVEGRFFTLSAPDEVMVNFLYLEKHHVHVGDTIDLALAGPGQDLAGQDTVLNGPKVRVRIVGVTAAIGDFVTISEPSLSVTPAFVDAYAAKTSNYELFAFRLRRSSADYPAFRADLARLTHGQPVFPIEADSDNKQVQRTFHLQALALWILAACLGLVSILIVAQLASRQSAMASGERSALRAVGMTGRQAAVVEGLRGLSTGVVAVVILVAIAAAGSVFTPFGRARLAERTAGFSFAWGPILAGAGLVVATCVVASMLGGALASRRARTQTRPSWLSRTFAPRARSVAPAVGIRFALEPGKGRRSVPVRTTLVGCCVGLVALMMALTVGTSLDHLLGTPRLYGWSYDVAVESDFSTPQQRAAIAALPGVAAVSFGGQGAPLIVDKVATEGMAFRAEDTQTGPLILDGRRPVALDEVALGRKTLGELHKRIGDRIRVGVQGTDLNTYRDMRIVGTTVLPLNGDQASLGEGVFFTYETVHALVPQAPIDTAFIRILPGKHAEVVKELDGKGFVDLPQQPAAVVDFGHVRAMPLILSSVLALLAAGTITHLLVTSVRRRRRDLAILKTLGFRRVQVSGSIAWQSGTLAVVALAVSVPLGIAAGRWIWTLFARYGGFYPEPVVSATDALIVIGATLLVSQLVAIVPGLNAGRTKPAVVLRAE